MYYVPIVDKNLDLPILGLETITGRSPHEFSEFWRSHPGKGVVVGLVKASRNAMEPEGLKVGTLLIGLEGRCLYWSTSLAYCYRT